MLSSTIEIDRLLAELRAIGAASPLMDIHVHPFDVFGGGVHYVPDAEYPGLWNSGAGGYKPPAATGFDPEAHPLPENGWHGDLGDRMRLLFLRRLYRHTGPRCFLDQMSLGGISQVLLLPVARPGVRMDVEMDLMQSIFGGEPRFLFGYSVPNTIPDRLVEQNLRMALARWGIRGVKVHPNLGRINLATSAGKMRMEAVLAAAGAVGLPVIVHGGPSPILPDAARDYGRLENLEAVDFRRTALPVIIAHAGAFGLAPGEVEREIIPRLKRLLAQHHNLLLDLSALPVPVILAILRAVDPERLLFGSDALYESPWKPLVRLFIALQRHCGSHCDDLLARMTGSNPAHIFGKEQVWNDTPASHQVSSIP